MSQLNPINGLSTIGLEKMKLMNSLLSALDKNQAFVRGRFTLFPKLPLELRLKIWRESFPGGRHVPLVTNSGSPPPLPTSLRESRAETLRFYVLFFKSDLHKDKKITQQGDIPFCFNPAWYSLWLPVSFLSTLPNCNTDFLSIWIDYIDHKLPDGNQPIQILELREFNNPSWYSAPGRWSAEVKYKSTSGKRGLKWFSGLDELMIVMARNTTTSQVYRASGYIQAGYFHEDEKTLTRWFMSSARSLGTKVPNVQWSLPHDVLIFAADVRD